MVRGSRRPEVVSARSLAQLAGVAIALREQSAASALRDLLSPHASLIGLTPFALSFGSISRYLSMLEQFLGRRQQARACFERAIDVNGRTGHELERLRTTLGLASLLAEGGNDGERMEASKLVARVIVSAQSAKLELIASSARELEATLTAAAIQPPAAKPPTRQTKAQRSRV